MAVVVDQAQAATEAAMSPDEARLYQVHRRGGRKFRLEGTAAGNSRFVCRETALRLQAKYGGRIVNYRPGRDRSRSVYEAAAAELGPCPRCEAPARAACMTVLGRPRHPHRARVTADD